MSWTLLRLMGFSYWEILRDKLIACCFMFIIITVINKVWIEDDIPPDNKHEPTTEWQEKKCNEVSDEDDILFVKDSKKSKIYEK